MESNKYINEMNFIYFGGANYRFRLCEAIEDLYALEANGYMAIRGMSDNWLDESLEDILRAMSMNTEYFDFEGSISDWKENDLFIIQLNTNNLASLKEYFRVHKKYYFCAEWISYFKEDEVLVDIGHAFDGAKEQLHLNNKLCKEKVKVFEKRRGFVVDWSG